MKRILLIIAIALLNVIESDASCYFACTDVDEDGNGTEYLVETDDQSGEVVSVTATGNNCLFGPWVRPCAIMSSGPFDEDVTAALSRLDLSRKRPPSREEKVYLENLLKTPGAVAHIDAKRLSPQVLAFIQGRH